MLIELDTKGRTRMPVGFHRFEAGTSPMEERASEPIPEITGLRINNAFVFGPFKLSVAERLLKRGEEALPIGGRALDLLTVLVERAGEVISHKELIARAWPDVTVEEANLRVHIVRRTGSRTGCGQDDDGARIYAQTRRAPDLPRASSTRAGGDRSADRRKAERIRREMVGPQRLRHSGVVAVGLWIGDQLLGLRTQRPREKPSRSTLVKSSRLMKVTA
jgi:hypothetical protein